MISIRTPWWAAAVLSLPLALAVGCGSTEDTTSTPTPTPTTSTPPATTTPAPSTSTDTKKDTEPVKAAPAPAKTEESPKVEAPKVEPPKVEAPKTESTKDAPKSAPKGASATKLSDEEVAEIKKLPAGEQVVALKQAVCPVSGEHLGSMDAPVKVSAEGKTFYLCCKGYKKDVDSDAKAVVAKLAK
jgi:YHS domain-containing protein